MEDFVPEVEKIVIAFQPRLSPYVKSVVDMCGIISKLAKLKSLDQLGGEDVESFISQIGALMVAYNKSYQPAVIMMQNFVTVFTTEVKNVQFLKKTPKDSTTGIVRQYVSICKRLMTLFQPDLEFAMAKIELSLMETLQVLECFASGNYTAESIIDFLTNLICQYSLPHSRNARLVQKSLKLVVGWFQNIDTKQPILAPGQIFIDWNKLGVCCVQIWEEFGLTATDQVFRYLRVLEVTMTALQRTSDVPVKLMKYSSILETYKELTTEYGLECSIPLDNWISVAKILEQEVVNMESPNSVLDTLANVTKLLTKMDSRYSRISETVSKLLEVAAAMVKNDVPNLGAQCKLSDVCSMVIPFVEQQTQDQTVLSKVQDLQSAVLGIETLLVGPTTSQLSERIEAFEKALIFFYPNAAQDLLPWMSISKLLEYQNLDISDITEAGLGKLIESVMKCSTDYLGGEASEASRKMLLQLLKKMVSILEQFNKKGNQFEVSNYMSVASEILGLINPKLKVDLNRLETLIKVVEEEASEVVRSDQLYSRALIQKSQKFFSLLSGSPSQNALKVGSLLQQLELFCGEEPEVNEQKLLKLMFGAVAVVSPKHRVQVEGFVEHGLKLISSSAGSSREMFMTWFREFMLTTKPSNFSQSELEQLIQAFEMALKQFTHFQT